MVFPPLKILLSIYIPFALYCQGFCARTCLKNHSRKLHAPLCGRFCPNSVAVARYGALIRTKSPTNCDTHLAESLFQTRSRKGIFQSIFQGNPPIFSSGQLPFPAFLYSCRKSMLCCEKSSNLPVSSIFPDM